MLKTILLLAAIAASAFISGCETIPSAGVGADSSGVSTNAGWGPVNGSVNSSGGFNVNVH